RLDKRHFAAQQAQPEQVLEDRPGRPTLAGRRCDHPADDDARSAHRGRIADGPMRETIVIAGSVAQRPNHGGHAWVFLQWLLGFKRLGYEVLFVDWLEPEMAIDRA